MTSGYMAILFISIEIFIDRMPFLAPTLENADPLFELVRFVYAPSRGGANQDPASGSL